MVLGSLGFAKDRDVWEPGVVRPETFDAAHPLARRWVRWWPWSYGALNTGLELDDRVEHTRIAEVLRDEEAREHGRLLYVAFTRARDRLVLAAAEKKGAACLEALRPLVDAGLAVPVGLDDGPAALKVGDPEWPCRVRTVSGADVEPEPATPRPRPRPWYDGAPPIARVREVATRRPSRSRSRCRGAS